MEYVENGEATMNKCNRLFPVHPITIVLSLKKPFAFTENNTHLLQTHLMDGKRGTTICTDLLCFSLPLFVDLPPSISLYIYVHIPITSTKVG